MKDDFSTPIEITYYDYSNINGIETEITIRKITILGKLIDESRTFVKDGEGKSSRTKEISIYTNVNLQPDNLAFYVVQNEDEYRVIKNSYHPSKLFPSLSYYKYLLEAVATD